MSGELSVSLNGFRIEFSSSQFELYSAAIPDNSRVEILREKLGPDWFIYWRKGIVYGLPRTDSVANPFESAPVTSRCEDYLWLLAARDTKTYFRPHSLSTRHFVADLFVPRRERRDCNCCGSKIFRPAVPDNAF